MSQRTRKVSDKILVWLKPPEWQPEDLGGVVTVPPVDKATRVKHGAAARGRVSRYIVGQFAVVTVIVFALLWQSASLGMAELSLGSALVLCALAVWGGLLEAKRWAVPMEVLRLLALAGAAAYLVSRGPVWVGAAGAAVATASAFWLLSVKAERRTLAPT